jgi:hypothetical protein
MRYLFYLLVFANLGFFLWKTGGDQKSAVKGTEEELSIPSGGERIQLLREIPILASADKRGMPSAAGGSAKNPSKSKKGKAGCYLIGPSQTQTDAESYRELLSSHTPDAAVVTRLGDVADGWWLLYPRALTAEIARQNRKMLSDKGIRDTWIFDNGPLQWGISLGLYDNLEKAEAAQKALAEKNIMIEVEPRMTRGNVYWVKIPWRKPALELEEIVQVLNLQDPGLHIPAPVPCE